MLNVSITVRSIRLLPAQALRRIETHTVSVSPFDLSHGRAVRIPQTCGTQYELKCDIRVVAATAAATVFERELLFLGELPPSAIGEEVRISGVVKLRELGIRLASMGKRGEDAMWEGAELAQIRFDVVPKGPQPSKPRSPGASKSSAPIVGQTQSKESAAPLDDKSTLVPCSLCGVSVKRGKLESHKATRCNSRNGGPANPASSVASKTHIADGETSSNNRCRHCGNPAILCDTVCLACT